VFTWFDLAWPWIGLAGAAAVVVLLARGSLRADAARPRWRDPRWLSFLGLAVYLVHQVEEYGIAANGIPHAFPDALCATLGQPGYPACSIPPLFYLAVNLTLVWIAAPLAAIFARRHPLTGLTIWGVIAVNAVVHLVPGIATLSYDPGMLTAAVLFVPLTAWTVHAAFGRRRPFRRRAVVPLIGAGIVMHAFLAGAALLFLHAGLPAWALIALQPIGIATGYGLVLAVEMRMRSTGSTDSDARIAEIEP
jgi:hypothetical protein